jgi:hypothetical protein
MFCSSLSAFYQSIRPTEAERSWSSTASPRLHDRNCRFQPGLHLFVADQWFSDSTSRFSIRRKISSVLQVLRSTAFPHIQHIKIFGDIHYRFADRRFGYSLSHRKSRSLSAWIFQAEHALQLISLGV